jgi:hypothetical protein
VTFTTKRIQSLARGEQGLFIAPDFMRIHADDHPSKEFRGVKGAGNRHIEGN